MNYLMPYEKQFSKDDRREMIGARLKRLRNENKYTQKFVSEAIGVNKQTYSGYENGASEPNAEVLVRLSYLYKISVDDIVQKNILVRDKQDMLNSLSKAEKEMRLLKEALGENTSAENKAMLNLMEHIGTLSDLLFKELNKTKTNESDKNV